MEKQYISLMLMSIWEIKLCIMAQEARLGQHLLQRSPSQPEVNWIKILLYAWFKHKCYFFFFLRKLYLTNWYDWFYGRAAFCTIWKFPSCRWAGNILMLNSHTHFPGSKVQWIQFWFWRNMHRIAPSMPPCTAYCAHKINDGIEMWWIKRYG